MTTAQAELLIGDVKKPEATIKTQFNPASLRVTSTNQFNESHPNQVSKPTAYKLDVELLFDTTETGADVAQTTDGLRQAAAASGKGATPKKGEKATPSSLKMVTFVWGTMAFSGYIESLNETLDYWSSDGVPLRSTFQISLKGVAEKFLALKSKPAAYVKTDPAPPSLDMVIVPAAKDNEAKFLEEVKAAGDTSTGRGVAAANGIENMRGTGSAVAGAGASASASASAGASAFAGASASAGAGAGFAAGAGAQLQAAAGFKLAGGVSAEASAGFGMGASAGLSAGAGLSASVGVGMAAGMGGGIGGGISAGAGIGLSGSVGIGGSAGIGAGMSGGGFGITTSTSVTGFDGMTRTTTNSSFTGPGGTTHSSSSTMTSSSAGVSASAGAFAGLGMSRTTLPSAGFNPESLLPPPAPAAGPRASYDVSGRVVSDDGQVAASYSARAGVQVW